MNAIPFIYQYGVGAVVMAVGMGFAWRHGYVGLERGSPRRNLVLMVGGLLYFMGLQGYLQFVAPGAEHITGGHSPVSPTTVGTPLDYGVIIGYFLCILLVGSYFGRNNKSTRDFFFGGQKFAWWFITMSLVATTIGSYSFVKYSRVAYTYGISSSQTYMNDWFWLPLFIFGWLPIIFFSRVVSIPEYFERRFNKATRMAMTVLLLVYLVGYIGINLYTMGVALHHLVGWDIFVAALVVAAVSAVYVTWGGQTSVIVTDLMQGFVLLLAGGLILGLGISALGGFGDFWAYLKPEHRQAFPNFNEDPAYSMVGVFWQDAMANSAVFLFLNQGIMMRFMSVRSINEGKKAAMATLVLLMPIAAMVVASGGWIGAAMDSAGMIPTDASRPEASQIFFWVAAVLCKPGVFGLVMAALTAALMSTVDTLITAVAAIWVNDIWRPYVRPDRPDSYYLSVARVCSVAVTLIGVVLVPVFMKFGSIYSAHAAFTAAITPPMVVTFLCAMLWPRFTSKAAICTLLGGSGLVLFSIFVPEVIEPFSHGIPAVASDGTPLKFAKAYKFTRALYGLSVSAVIAVVVTLVTRPRPKEELKGLVIGTVTPPGGGSLRDVFKESPRALARVVRGEADSFDPKEGRYLVRLSSDAMGALGVVGGDKLLLSDRRWWFGGLRSVHGAVAEQPLKETGSAVELGPEVCEVVARSHGEVVMERLVV